jgi:hypothetical protein
MRLGGGLGLLLAALLAFNACHPQEPPVKRDGHRPAAAPAARG